MKALLLILTFVLSSTVVGQTVQAKVAKFDLAKYYSVDYDPTSKTTTVKSPTGNTIRSGRGPFRTIMEWMELRFPGTEPKGNATLDLGLRERLLSLKITRTIIA